MRWLIRTINRKKKGAVSHSDETFGGNALTIGRAAGQGLFLSDVSVALEHARIVPVKGGRFRVESQIAVGVRVDGKLQQSAGAGYGSRIEIGPYVIRIVRPPSGYEAAVEVEKVEVASEASAGKFANRAFRLSDTWLGKRGVSWLLFIGVLTIGLLIPVMGNLFDAQRKLRDIPLVPDDSLWEAGTLQSAHHYFGEDCNSCHLKPFQRVNDEACVSCHSKTLAHADPEFFALPELEDTACGICHRDHNGLDGLVRQDQALCQDCHDDLDSTTAGKTALANAHDFGANHPQFKVELAAWAPDGSYQPRREPLDSPTLSEDSNLKFPHDVHLNPDGINSPTRGKTSLDCESCHRPEAGGAKMQEVNFESMCQDCHRLGFDAQAPDREVPHGEVAEVLYMLEEYYANRALVGGYDDVTAPAVVRQRRRPGERLSRAQTQEALAWARSKSRRVGQDLFEGRACGVCHYVDQTGEGEMLGWDIAPTRVAGVWFPKSYFTHASHTTMACADCHTDVRSSSSSDDVNMPAIEVCQACHGGENERGKVASTCVSCHKYHIFEDLNLAEQ